MARFIIADLTDPGSVPHELATIAQGTVVPIQPILSVGQEETYTETCVVRCERSNQLPLEGRR